MKFFIVCPRGLEGVLHAELEQIIHAFVDLSDIEKTLDATEKLELEKLAASISLQPLTPKVSGGLEVAGPLGLAMAINLNSRIASRVLIQLQNFTYKKEEDVYKVVRGLRWEEWFSPEQTLRVDVTSHRSPLTSLNFVTLRIKDGICDRLREVKGARPSIDTATPDIRVVAHLDATHASIYLDTSGEALFKRGWRDEKGAAPLKENLAAGILFLSGWQPDQPLFDPMCGSGTFLIEAAQIALAIPPGAIRAGILNPSQEPSSPDPQFSEPPKVKPAAGAWQSPISVTSGQPIRDVKNIETPKVTRQVHSSEIAKPKTVAYKPTRVDLVSSLQGFGFLRLRPFLTDKEQLVWKILKSIATMRMQKQAQRQIQIAGSDIHEKMVAICKRNWQKAGLPGLPIVRQIDALATKAPFQSDGVMLFNPPYGERLELKGGRGGQEERKGRSARDPLPKNIANPEFMEFLAQFGRHLKEQFGGWQVHVLTADMGLPGQLRMKESKRTPLFNGAIECRLFRFDIRSLKHSSRDESGNRLQ